MQIDPARVLSGGEMKGGLHVGLQLPDLAVVLLAVPLAALLLAAATPPPDAYARALELYRAGRFEQAVALLEPVAKAEPAKAGLTSLLGWCRFRLGRIGEARAAFEASVASDPAAADARTGLGYVALREGDPWEAVLQFEQALGRAPKSLDALKGLGMARRQTGDRKGAAEAYGRALALGPDDAEIHALLAENAPAGDPVEEVRPRPPVPATTPLRLISRAGNGRLEVRSEGRYRPLFVKGIDLGTALPGKFPAEFPDDPKLYRRWFDLMGEAGFNVVRLYTLHPPSLYRALAEHNAEHPGERLWLVQGVWTELAENDDYDDPRFMEPFADEIRRVIDATHGNLRLPSRPGHAHGIYDTDISGDLLALLIGREFEPHSVVAYEKTRPGRTRHDGAYVRAENVRPFEAWLASVLDLAARHETETYRAQRALGFVSWPTLDPLHHPTEATSDEETSIRLARGEVLEEPIKEYDNDRVDLDTLHLRPTEEFRAGIYACYHAYPYYPDFMMLDPGYNAATDHEGRNNYIGYLRALKAHHGGQPVLIGEFGVPTSRGIAHLQPQGMHHGGHTTIEQGRIDARLFRNIFDAGLAGGMLFSWMDEWFKRNWLVMNYEVPVERNRLWHNALDAEQNYGLLAARAGSPGSPITIDGRGEDWAGVKAVYDLSAPERPDDRPRPRALRVTSDEAYLYLRLDIDPGGGPLDLGRYRFWIGIDTYDAQRGSHRFPDPVAVDTPAGMEFLLRLEGDGSRLQVDRPYDLFSNRLRRPYRSLANDAGDFIDIQVFTNRDRFGRDGTYFPLLGYDRSPLRHGSTDSGDPDFDSLAEWRESPGGGFLEVRLPWGILNVTDPSSHQVVHETTCTEGAVETATTEGFRFHVLALEPSEGGLRVFGRLPDAESPRLADFPVYSWSGWEQPRYYLDLKESYAIVREALRELPDFTDEEP